MISRLSCAALLATTLPAFSATLVLDEADFVNSNSGQADFDNVLSVANTDNVGATMAGANQLSGSLGGYCDSNNCTGFFDAGDGQDSVGFTVAAGFRITGFTITKIDTMMTPINMGFAITDIGNQPELSIAETFGDTYTTGGLDIGPGTYFFSVGARRDGFNRNDYAFDWNAIFTGEAIGGTGGMSPVPLPASAPLLLAGLGAFFGLRRRRAQT